MQSGEIVPNYVPYTLTNVHSHSHPGTARSNHIIHVSGAGEKLCLYVLLLAFLLALVRLHKAHVSMSYFQTVSNSIFYLGNYDLSFSY